MLSPISVLLIPTGSVQDGALLAFGDDQGRTDGGEHLLHFVTEDMPTHFKRLPSEELAMRLIRERDARASGEFITATDEHRDRHQTACFG